MVRSVFSLMRTTKEINEDESVRDDCAGKPESKNIKYLVPHRPLAGVVLRNHDRRLLGEGFAVGDRYLSRIKLGHRRSPPLVQERPPVVIAYSASRSALLQRRFNTSSKFNPYL